MSSVIVDRSIGTGRTEGVGGGRCDARCRVLRWAAHLSEQAGGSVVWWCVVNPFRVFLLVFAVGMIPFALTSYNGATLLGVVAVVVLIILTVKDAPREVQK